MCDDSATIANSCEQTSYQACGPIQFAHCSHTSTKRRDFHHRKRERLTYGVEVQHLSACLQHVLEELTGRHVGFFVRHQREHVLHEVSVLSQLLAQI